jgi:hypothetical protein
LNRISEQRFAPRTTTVPVDAASCVSSASCPDS